ncbi:MAG: helicase-related protein [Chloroflexota bacterium]
MSRLTPTPELIENILTRIPEGFIHQSALAQRIKLDRRLVLTLVGATVGRDGEYWYDMARQTQEQMRLKRGWCRPNFPDMTANGYFLIRPIAEQNAARSHNLQHANHENALQILERLASVDGYAKESDLCPSDADQASVQLLLDKSFVRRAEEWIYDPLCIGSDTIKEIIRLERLEPLRREVVGYLNTQPGQTAVQTDLRERFGKDILNDLLVAGQLVSYSISADNQPLTSWIRLKDANHREAEQAARAAMKQIAEDERIRENEQWMAILPQCGDMIRPDAREGKTGRLQVIARTYTVVNAAKRLGVRERTLEQAIGDDIVPIVIDPEGAQRIPTHAVEMAVSDTDYHEKIATYEALTARDISIVCDVTYPTARRRLQRVGIKKAQPQWGEIRGKWNLPATLTEFYALRKQKLDELRAARDAERAEEERLVAEQRRLEREQRDTLRARLVAAFPTWQHDGRGDQRIYLHIGPPNSGKTHEALNALAEAQSGWYLAPLRLLAYEIFDRMNQRGVRCNLLTGEEHIPVEGATITAATVEMFDPGRSGECVIIDEAQLLADPDRGWAWTRAMMETLSPDIHIIGPQTAQGLIQQLAGAAAMPVTVIEHERLAPIQIAENNWPLAELPARTILVAFSRQMVLQLKMELERMKRRVSVVYGSLPPEVRRRQADRFANGETEICIATDAVGMGLNLPADYVCFYEIEKFDGKQVRYLTPSEVQQIGGRAGRYGLSQAGEIGATSRQELKLVKQLYYTPPINLTHARVAPSVADLALLPGNLGDKLSQWASLQSIPESLRTAIQTADMDERIELARMLTDEEVEQLGLSAALRLVNAPARQSTRDFWMQCAHAILKGVPMPMPPDAPQKIDTSVDLESVEACVSAADIYLWLANRREFGEYGPDEHEVRIRRTQWSMRIDVALQHKLDMARRCSKCGTPLPIRYRYGICADCFAKRMNSDEEHGGRFPRRNFRPQRRR